MNMKINDTIKVVSITDYTEYREGHNHTDGQYSYTDKYRRISHDLWELTYSTSADFSYCPVSGGFEECENCPCYEDGEYTCKPKKVSTVDLQKAIDYYVNKKHYQIEVE